MNTPSRGQSRVKIIRRAQEDGDPAWAAERAAERFERGSVSIPAKIAEYPRVVELYRDIVLAGADGITLTDLRGDESTQGVRAEAIHSLRKSGVIIERRERRLDKAGRPRDQVVLYGASL